ncbi:set domain protein [Culex quinquefasciatus]|uniref:Set domain protein n=1 Tax=Culex quinquefasciatus TaxID=7176 RepID=B0XCE4_CULQU|nr:set domain protein [Culex quinquefasciatus]|eukprot:XP_001867316.1 set domain protein [Culex quinquefasciatus]
MQQVLHEKKSRGVTLRFCRSWNLELGAETSSAEPAPSWNRHLLEQCSINVNWSFLCCKGGSIICCKICLTAYPLVCLQFNPPEGRFICGEFESGRLHLYDEIVWAKYSMINSGLRSSSPRRKTRTTLGVLTGGEPTNYVLESPMYVMIKSNKYVASLREQNAAGDEEEDSILRARLELHQPGAAREGQSEDLSSWRKLPEPVLKTGAVPGTGGPMDTQQAGSGRIEGHPPWSVCDRVREVINNKELARRIKQKQEQKNKNVNFLTVDSKLTIDAGPNWNLAQFINHSCKPNCEMLMWKLTFNYNFETFGDQKKICQCCASKCPGLIVSQGKENCNEETTTVLRDLQVQIATWITCSSAQTLRVTTTAATTAPPPTTPAANADSEIPPWATPCRTACASERLSYSSCVLFRFAGYATSSATATATTITAPSPQPVRMP